LDELIFPVLRRIGAGWEEAAIAPAKEHFASELVKRHIDAALVDAGPSSAETPRIILACPEGERHDVGLLGLCLLLRAEGVNTVFLGAEVPTPDLLEARMLLEPDAICLSATSANGLASLVRASRTLVARRGVRLFVGGPAVSPEGVMAAGTRLPPSVSEAAGVIASALAGRAKRGR
jgi:MerR family transcriptional regulator, light-induced transcriptional regulator